MCTPPEPMSLASSSHARTTAGQDKTEQDMTGQDRRHLRETQTGQPPSLASHHQQQPQTSQQPQQPPLQPQLPQPPQIRVDTVGGVTSPSGGASFRRVSSTGDAASAADGGSESGSMLLTPSEVSMELDPQALDDGASVSPSLSGQQEDDTAVSQHPDIAGVPTDFQGYIEALDIGKRLQQLPRPASGTKEAERFKEYQLALHEVAFSSKSHLRALTLLQLLFVQPWPQANRHVLQQLGLHFVPECIALYRSLLYCVMEGPNQADYQQKGQLEKFGERLLAWYSDEANSLNFQRLGLSFGFAKTTTRRKTASINEDDIILRLIGLRREDPQFNRFFAMAEVNPAMNKRRFVDLYSVNMQQTMRMVTLLDTAARKAKKAKDTCDFAEKDAENLEKCTARAKAISDYCNSTGAKLKELSRQLVLSKSFENFWDRANSDDSHLVKFKGQISHLHTCQLHLTREVLMPGLEGYRLRLFVFTDFLLVISESEEARGVKYQLLKQLGPSMSVDSQQSQPTQPQQQPSAEKASLIEANCPPVIPMKSVVHVFDTASEARRRLPGSRAVDAEFRIIVEQTTIGAGGRVKPLMLEFRMSQDKPLMPFSTSETQHQAGEFVDCIKCLTQRQSENRALLDRHSSLSSSALDLPLRPGLPSLEHRRVHSTAGLRVAKLPAGAPVASAAVASRLMPSGDESDAESLDDKQEEQPAAPDSQSGNAASAAAATSSSSMMVQVSKNLAGMEALLKVQQQVLPQALGLTSQTCHDAISESSPDSSVEMRSRAFSNEIADKFRLSRVSEVPNDNQTQPPQVSVLVERRAQFSAAKSAPPIPLPRPPKLQTNAKATGATASVATPTARATAAPTIKAGSNEGLQIPQAAAAITPKTASTPAANLQNNNDDDEDNSSSSSTESTETETDSEDYSTDASDDDEMPPPRPASTASAKSSSDV